MTDAPAIAAPPERTPERSLDPRLDGTAVNEARSTRSRRPVEPTDAPDAGLGEGSGDRSLDAMAGPQIAAAATAAATGAILWPFNCDDAAISFRFVAQFADGAPLGTLAAGEPLVSGFSNPLWTVLLSGAHRIGLPITGTAKALGLLAAIATAVLVVRLVALLGGRRVAQWSAAAVGLSTTTAIWAVSGMENASVGLLVVATAHLLVAGEVRSSRWAFAGASLTAALLGVSRPDAFVHLGAAALAVGIAFRRTSGRPTSGRRTSSRRRSTEETGPLGWLGRVVGWVAVPGLVLAAWTGFSVVRFGHPLPNTYYAKVDTSLSDRLLDPIGSLQEPWTGTWTFAVTTAALVLVPLALVAIARRWRGPASTPLLLLIAALALPLSERDWMRDHRFFTTAVPLLVLFAALGAEDLWDRRRQDPSPVTRVIAVSAIALVAVWGATNLRLSVDRRTSNFAGQVTTESIGAQARDLAAVAEHHGIHDPLVMTADAGATLFDEQLRMVDLAGLVDPQVGQSMDDPDGRAEYAFTERRPDVVYASTADWSWNRLWQLSDDNLRRAGYLRTDAVEREVYVRRDLVVRPASTTGGGLRVDGLLVPPAVDGGAVTVRAWISGIDRDPAGDQVRFRLARTTGEERITTAPLGDLLDPGPGWSDDEAVLHVARLEPPLGSGPLTLTVTTEADPTTVLATATVEDGAGAVARAAATLTDGIASSADAADRLAIALDLVDAAPGNADVVDATREIRQIGRRLLLAELTSLVDGRDTSPGEAPAGGTVAIEGNASEEHVIEGDAIEAVRRRLPLLRGRHDPSAEETSTARELRHQAAASTDVEDRYRTLVLAWTLDPRPADVQAELLEARAARPSTNPLLAPT